MKREDQEFDGAIHGVDLNKGRGGEVSVSKNEEPSKDITQRSRKEVKSAGFGVGKGLGYRKIGAKKK